MSGAAAVAVMQPEALMAATKAPEGATLAPGGLPKAVAPTQPSTRLALAMAPCAAQEATLGMLPPKVSAPVTAPVQELLPPERESRVGENTTPLSSARASD